MCEVVGDEDQLFKEEYLRYYEGDIVRRDSGAYLHITSIDSNSSDEYRPVNIFMGVDPASSTKQTADYSTVVTVAVDKDNNRFVLPYYRNRATPLKLAEKILAQFKIYKPDKTRIESVGYQEMLREYIKKRCDEENIFVAGLEIKENPRNSKSSRLETMEPYFAMKKTFIRKDMQEIKDELLLYPRGKHDDLLDGLYYATKKIYPPNHEEYSKSGDKKESGNVIKLQDNWMTA